MNNPTTVGGNNSDINRAAATARNGHRSVVWDRILRGPNAEKLVQQTTGGGRNALHRACYANAPAYVVAAICDLCPRLVAQTDDARGNTPLLCACDNASEEVVNLLLGKAPHTVAVASKDGRLPFYATILSFRTHALIRRVASTDPAVVRRNRRWPKAMELYHTVVVADDGGAGDQRASSIAEFRDTFSLLLEAHVRGRLVKRTVENNDDEWILSHETVRHSSTVPIGVAMVKFVLETNSVAPESDRRGNFPLHVACELSPEIAQGRQ